MRTLIFRLFFWFCTLNHCVSSINNPRTIRLMTFNIWQSGVNVNNGLTKIAKHILIKNPDIVALPEVLKKTSLPVLLKLLGSNWSGKSYDYDHPDVGIVTRHRIVKTKESTENVLHANGAVRAKVAVDFTDGSSVVTSVWTIHLAFQNYGTYVACNKTIADHVVYGRETGRVQNIEAIMNDKHFRQDADDAAKNGQPMFVMGDFNCPSPQDWIAKTTLTNCDRIFAWPATGRLLNNFADAYRTVHPDPSKNPGYTWSPVTKCREDLKVSYCVPEKEDRIDFIFYKAPKWRPRLADVYNGTKSIMPKPKHRDNDWPSDHSAVYAEFESRVDLPSRKPGK